MELGGVVAMAMHGLGIVPCMATPSRMLGTHRANGATGSTIGEPPRPINREPNGAVPVLFRIGSCGLTDGAHCGCVIALIDGSPMKRGSPITDGAPGALGVKGGSGTLTIKCGRLIVRSTKRRMREKGSKKNRLRITIQN